MTEEKSYNGWANYATWRIMLEIMADYVEPGEEEGEK